MPAPAPRAVRTTNLASLTPNQIIEARGYWQGLPEMPRETTGVSSISGARRVASADLTASIGPFERNDRVSPDLALAYAAQAPASRGATAVVTQQGSASIAAKPANAEVASTRSVQSEERLNNPWTRGLVIAPSVQNSMVTTTFGVPDFRALTPFMRKPASAMVMTFTTRSAPRHDL